MSHKHGNFCQLVLKNSLANILTTYVTLFYMALLDLGTCAILISVAFAASKPELKDISVGKP